MLTDRVSWIVEHLRIVSARGELIPLRPNIGQLMLHKSMQAQIDSGNPVRIVLLKPRQVGWSTWTEAEIFERLYRNANRTGLVVSADTEATDLIFNMARTFQAEIRPNFRRPTIKSNRKEIVFAPPHRSRLLTQTAGKDVLGRGGTVQYLHISEYAFWPKAEQQFGAVVQMVPKHQDTLVVIESTANGMGGGFHDMFMEAVDRQRMRPGDYAGYIPVFFPWYKFPEYCLFPPPGWSPDGDGLEFRREVLAKDGFEISDGQLYWRQIKIKEDPGGIDHFLQEYPHTPLVAFQTSGRPVFSQSLLASLAKGCTEGRTCVLTKTEPVNVNRSVNCWTIWKLPRDGHEYTIGIDTMEGRVSDGADIKSDLDRHAVVIYDRVTGEVVAQYYGQCDQHDLADQVVLAGNMYNTAWLAPEIPNGMVVLDVLKQAEYPKIYNRQIHDDTIVSEDTEALGWRTTTATRPQLIGGITGALRDGDLRIYSIDLIDEMRTFIRDKTGKEVHMPGKHDDLIFALGIALQLHIRLPFRPQPYAYAHTFEGDFRPRRDDLSLSGAVDPGPEEEEEICFTT